MKTFLKFLSQSILIGAAILSIAIVIMYPMVAGYEYISTRIELNYIAFGATAAMLVGVLTTYFYLTPLNLAANLFLKIYTSFYGEFFKQGARYFAKDNKSKPFENVVEIKISAEISMLGFLTFSSEDGSNVVFIPTSRRLTSGINLIVKGDNLKTVEISPEQFLKFIVTAGAYKVKR